MTPGKRIMAINQQERQVTIAKFADLPVSDAAKQDIAQLFMRLQDCLNQFAAEKDKVFDFRVRRFALALLLEDGERVFARLRDEGLIIPVESE